MRLPLWMGMLSVAGVVWAAAPATGQVDPAAKKALEESAEAIKNMGPCTFTVKMGPEGLGKFGLSSDLKVKLIRAKPFSSYQIEGEFVSPGGKPDDTKVHAADIEGKMGEWIDEPAKTLFIRPLKAVKTDAPSKEVLTKVQTPSKAFDVLFLVPEPFKGELGSPELSTLRAMIEHVLQVEGPILDEVLARRIARAHGWSRTGALTFQRRVLSIAIQMGKTTTEEIGTFFWPPTLDPQRLLPFRHPKRRGSTQCP